MFMRGMKMILSILNRMMGVREDVMIIKEGCSLLKCL